MTFAPSETEKTVNVTVVDDDTLENTEGFIAMLSAAPGSTFMTGATGIATANIIDDDSKPSAVLGLSCRLPGSRCLIFLDGETSIQSRTAAIECITLTLT